MKYLLSLLSVAFIVMTGAAKENLNVTVYNNNLGVVSELRNLTFSKGTGKLAFTEVPSGIDPASVRFELSSQNGGVSILEQNYAFDLVSPEQMYRKYIDKEIELIDEDGKLYFGTLLTASHGAVTLLEKSGRIKIIMLSKISEVNFPSLPDGLITRPTLFWLYNSSVSGNIDCRVSYQTSGISWNAEYVGVLDVTEKILDLSGWASINNTSGKTYTDVSLKLIAGDIKRAQQFQKGRGADVIREDMAFAAAPGFQEKEFFEYHLYTLPRKATLADREIKQISLFEPASTSVTKIYTLYPDRANDVVVSLKFKNSEKSGLGMPLPAGRVRLFKADADGSMVLLGEDNVKHTPKDEELKLVVGNAFDIKAEYKTVSHTRISSQVVEEEHLIEIRNHKSELVNVIVEKKLYGDWQILESTMEYKKEDAMTIIFDAPVGAGGKTVIHYKVRFNNR